MWGVACNVCGVVYVVCVCSGEYVLGLCVVCEIRGVCSIVYGSV